MRKWILLLLVVTFTVVGIISQLKIRHLTCQTIYGTCPDYYLARVDYLLGKSWVFLPQINQIKTALNSYTEIADVALVRKFPNTLKLQIKLHTPVGIVNNYLVDDSGQILALASASALSRLSVPEVILPGKKLNDQQLAAVTVINSVSEIFPNVLGASLSGQILQFTIGTTTVLFDVNSLPNSYSDSLQLIFTRSKVEGTAPKRVDMRFNNPIIVY